MELKNCVYRLIDKKSNILYVGKSKNLKNRIRNNSHTSKHLSSECYNQTSLIEYIKFDYENDMDFAEQYYIQKYKPKYNTIYQKKQITIDVPELDKKTWSIFYIDKNTADKQLSDFYNNLYGEKFKFITIKVDVDLFDYLNYCILKESDCFRERKLFQSFIKSGEFLNSTHAMWYKNIIKENQKNVNLGKLDLVLNFEKNLYNEINKNISLMFKEYPLLSYLITTRPEKASLMYDKDILSLPDLISTLDLKNNRFLMTLYIFYKTDAICNINKSTMIQCTLYVECT